MNVEKEILATLTYFNMFDYPLKKRELFIFLGKKTTQNDFESSLAVLLAARAIFQVGNYYSLFNNHTIVERRIKANRKAEELLKKALHGAHIISRFPYVRGVAVSGSLSKRVADEDADIDFFIITAANRLWIARSLLHVFKKFTYLFKRQHHFCMNYFIDESRPIILEKNIYTATEVVTLMPVYGDSSFSDFFRANHWARKFFPNNAMYVSARWELKKNWLSWLTEKTLNNKTGSWLDNLLMSITRKSWQAKEQRQSRNERGKLLAMHVGKHFSKPAPGNFQQKLLDRYFRSLSEVLQRYQSGKDKKHQLPRI